MANVERKSSSSKTSSGDNGEEYLYGLSSRNKQIKRNNFKSLKGQTSTSVSELLNNFVFTENKENRDEFCLEDLRNQPDLWMAAFDNPMDFIQYCRKRLDHDRKLLEKSKLVENSIVQLLERWTKNSERYGDILNDLHKVQDMNDKLQEVVMEERTHCQHLIGVNDQLETQRKIMARKYQASLLLGKVEDRAVEHLLEKDPEVASLTDQVSSLSEQLKKCDLKSKNKPECMDPVILADKVKRLEDYIHGLKQQHREEVGVLKDSIEKNDLKVEAICTQYQHMLKQNADSMKELKKSLCDSIEENMYLREELVSKNDKFLNNQMGQVKDANRKRPTSHMASGDNAGHVFSERTAMEKDLKVRLARSEIELVEKSNILQDSLAKYVMLERKCNRLEEQNAFLQKAHQNCVRVMNNRNELLKKRCAKSEERRLLDNAGFREDIRELRSLLKTLNKSVQKCLRYYSEENVEAEADVAPKPSDQDLEKIISNKKASIGFKSWIKTADPKKSQQALGIWTDFMGRKLEQVESRVKASRKLRNYVEAEVDDEVQTLFDNKAKMTRSSDSVDDFSEDPSVPRSNFLPSSYKESDAPTTTGMYYQGHSTGNH